MTPTLLLLASLAGADPVPRPSETREDEPVAKAFSPAKAAAYLDEVGVSWTRERKCVTCHTNMPYMLARPLLAGDAGWKEVRTFLEKDVESWSNGGKPKGDAYVVVTAIALAFHDRQSGRGLHPATRAALDRMWTIQKSTGEWNWLKCNWPPLEHDDYYGATLAALAVGVAPGDYAKTDTAKAGIEKLRAYFQKTPAPDLHHKAMLLWASTKLDGLLSADEQRKAVAELKAKQRPDGSWALPSLGTYKRHDGSDNDPAGSGDGYATGLVVYVLRQAGVAVSDPAVAGGVAWLKVNQRESGRWYTRSLNNDKAHYITHAGTAFAVLALDAVGEKLAAR